MELVFRKMFINKHAFQFMQHTYALYKFVTFVSASIIALVFDKLILILPENNLFINWGKSSGLTYYL